MLEKIWDRHLVEPGDGPGSADLIYVDLHLVHEVTSPQAFEGLRLAGRRVRRPELTLATADHNVPTDLPAAPVTDPAAARQLDALTANCAEFDICCYPMGHERQGIVHVIAPEQGLSQPGMTIVCGDSHTSTHGALGALAFGIGTSEVGHVLATQTLPIVRPASASVEVVGRPSPEATAKDLALAIVAALGTGGGSGCVLEYRGPAIEALSMEQRLTLCNMSIEAGARAGMIAPDEVTIEYLRGRPHVPSGDAFDAAAADWRTLRSDPGAVFDRSIPVDVTGLGPQVTWGTNPAQIAPLDGVVPHPASLLSPGATETAWRALRYMALDPGTAIRSIDIDTVFLGSCTNARIEDLRLAAAVLDGRHVAPSVRMLVVPGSAAVASMAHAEGIDEVVRAAGAEWRAPGCSMCLGMNPDRLAPGQRCASTSNRNFEGRQGRGGRTHLVSPAVAAATAVAGHLAAPSDLP
jgi:3-isopropylmalate/(R)-2-methylmalate dehydratase large subunit